MVAHLTEVDGRATLETQCWRHFAENMSKK